MLSTSALVLDCLGVSKKTEGCFKKDLKEFQGRFKVFLRKIEGCFIEVGLSHLHLRMFWPLTKVCEKKKSPSIG